MEILPKQRDNSEITVSVLWHSTVLINMYGKFIITDPVLFERVWLQIGKWKVGIKRISPLAIDLKDLPKIDMILISHTHMDHLDIQSIKYIVRNNNPDVKIICPHNGKKVIGSIASTNEVYELDRDKSVDIDGISIGARETNHRWARRPRNKRKHTRWSNKSHSYNAYMISTRDKRIFFGWDTAYIDIYKNTWYQVDVAIMPIWGYDPRIRNHCDPEQAIDMALDLWAKYFIPIHCETFILGKEWIHAPRKLLTELVQDRKDILLWSQIIWDIFIVK